MLSSSDVIFLQHEKVTTCSGKTISKSQTQAGSEEGIEFNVLAFDPTLPNQLISITSRNPNLMAIENPPIAKNPQSSTFPNLGSYL